MLIESGLDIGSQKQVNEWDSSDWPLKISFYVYGMKNRAFCLFLMEKPPNHNVYSLCMVSKYLQI